MPLKVSVTLHCAECGKKVPLRGKTFTKHSRRYGSRSGIYLPDVYVVDEPEDYNEHNSMEIHRGFEFLGDGDVPDDDDGLVCGLECAIKRATANIKKLRPEKIEKED